MYLAVHAQTGCDFKFFYYKYLLIDPYLPPEHNLSEGSDCVYDIFTFL